mmetsp:Transcript_124929/g.266659  ORF Transcript_124929/g.266659 Transcript_124929/m.266659 type:complete len:203 (+) Transcript_124929:320-928(+)
MAATRAATIFRLPVALSGTSKWTFLSAATGMSNTAHFLFSESSMKSSASSVVVLFSSSLPRIDSSSGKPYLRRAIECLNWRYSHSWTCKVHAVMQCSFVLAWAPMRGKDLNFAPMRPSAFFSVAQKCFAWALLEAFTDFSKVFKPLALSLEASPISPSKQRKGGAAPVPTSHCFSRNCSLGYAKSMQTVSILAQVSPQPWAC